MSELLENQNAPSIQEMEDEPQVQHFCKFTFAQFFTIMILAVFTMGFMFYLGARYGNDYLRLGQTGTPAANTAAIVTGIPQAAGSGSDSTDEMMRVAREALQQQQSDKMQQQVANILQNPAAYQQQLNQQPMPPGAVGPAAGVPTATVQTAHSRVNEYEPTPTTAAEQQALPVPQAIPPYADAAITPVPSATSTYSVQVAASQDVAEANQWVQGWRDRGYSAFLMVADLPEKGRWYRVRLGTFPSRDSAEAFAGQLKTKEQVDAIAVQNE